MLGSPACAQPGTCDRLQPPEDAQPPAHRAFAQGLPLTNRASLPSLPFRQSQRPPSPAPHRPRPSVPHPRHTRAEPSPRPLPRPTSASFLTPHFSQLTPSSAVSPRRVLRKPRSAPHASRKNLVHRNRQPRRSRRPGPSSRRPRPRPSAMVNPGAPCHSVHAPILSAPPSSLQASLPLLLRSHFSLLSAHFSPSSPPT